MDFTPLPLHAIEGLQDGVVIRPHTRFIPIHNVAHLQRLVPDIQALVNLLLVLREQDDCFAVVQKIGHLLRSEVRVHGYNFASQCMRGILGPVMLWLILTNDGNGLARFDARLVHAQRNLSNVALHIRKAVLPPNAALLMALGKTVGVSMRMLAQQLGKGRDFEFHWTPSPR